MHIVCMRTTWDPQKAATNLAKHGVRFSDAELVLYDPLAVTVEDEDAEDEQPRRRPPVDLGATSDPQGEASL